MESNWQVVIHRDKYGYEDSRCKWCGCGVSWQYSKKGHKYLAQPAPIFNEDGRQIKTIYPAHRCEATAERRAEIINEEAQRLEVAINAGEIVKGQKVTVAKGRKYPIGTTGTVTWVADREDAYGVIKVRVAVDGGEAIFINKANLKVTAKVGS